jgi:hypothetical protein
MRTTVTLDADVHALLEKSMKVRRLSFKQALNDAVRKGLTADRPRKKFVQKTFAMGAPSPNFRWEKILDLSEAIEDEEIFRKIQLRK